MSIPRQFMNMRRSYDPGRELARLLEKVADLRQRVWSLALIRGAFGLAWMWLLSLFVLGTLGSLLPLPSFVRTVLLLAHLALLVVGFLAGVRYAHAGGGGIRGLRLRTWALRCEELYPMLEGRLVTCVELAESPVERSAFQSSPVARVLLRETAQRFWSFDAADAVPRRHFILTALGILVPMLLFGVMCLQFPNYTKRVAASLYMRSGPSLEAAQPTAEGIRGLEVRPGNVEVARGGSVTVEASIALDAGASLADVPEVQVLEKTEKGDRTQRYAMIADVASPDLYKLALHDIRNASRYQVHASTGARETQQARSPLFEITVYDPPVVESVKTRVRPPAYTGAAEEEIEGTFVKALIGSDLTMRVRSDHELASASLVSETGERIAGVIANEPGEAQGKEAEFRFPVKAEASLRVELVDRARRENVDPPLVVLHAVNDEPPKIAMKRPGADWSVHPVAEIVFEAEATDDFGLKEVVWEYRINDAPPVTETLFTAETGRPSPRTQAVSRTMALEDMHVEVGDSIFYRFEARDGRLESTTSTGVDVADDPGISQPFFLTIRPYDALFYRANPLPTGQGGPPPPTQRAVIVATMRLVDRWSRLDDAEKQAMLADLERTQREVRVYSERLREKLNATPDLPDKPKRIEHMNKALEDMQRAEELIRSGDPSGALAPENSALRHLIAALAGLPQFETWATDAMPSAYPPDAPTALSGQRLDVKGDKYELANAAQRNETDQQLSDAIEKIRALAQRQKEFMETLKREMPPQGSGSAGANYEDARSSAEESRHQLERLREAVEQLEHVDDDTLRKLREGLDKAARELARMNEAVNKKDADAAQGANARALDQLHELELNLAKARRKNANEHIEELRARLEDWSERQKALQTDSQGLSARSLSEQQAARPGLAQQQGGIGQEARQEGETLGPGAAGGNAKTEEALAKLRAQLDETASWAEQAAKDLEQGDDPKALMGQEAIVRRLDEMKRDLDQVIADLPDPSNEPMAVALEAVRRLKQEIQAPASPPGKEPEGDSRTSAVSQPMSRTQFQREMEQIGSMLQGDPQMSQAVQTVLAQMKGTSGSSSSGNVPAGGARGGGSAMYPSAVGEALDVLEELLLERLQMAEQVQRLQQLPPEALPAKYREMADKYFENLSATAPRSPSE